MAEQTWNKRTEKQVHKERNELFQSVVLPYLNSAYNLARWLMRNEHDAEDIIQESSLRAWRSFDTFLPGRDGRAWFLAIVRNTCCSSLRKSRSHGELTPLDDDLQPVANWLTPEALLIRDMNSQLVRQAVEDLPLEYREVLILRELEELSYKEIATIVEIPLGTVMSRLSRARRELHAQLSKVTGKSKA